MKLLAGISISSLMVVWPLVMELLRIQSNLCAAYLSLSLGEGELLFLPMCQLCNTTWLLTLTGKKSPKTVSNVDFTKCFRGKKQVGTHMASGAGFYSKLKANHLC